jgi:hypothetical protein
MIRLFLLLLLLVVCISKTTSYELERFEFEGNSHFAFGYTLGAKFQTKIQARIGQHVQLQNRLLPFYYKTEEGKELYQKFLTIHRRIFPVSFSSKFHSVIGHLCF